MLILKKKPNGRIKAQGLKEDHMKINKSIAHEMLRWFIMLSFLHTILFYISFLIALDSDTFLTIIRLALMISVPVILIFFIIFFLLDRKYRRILQNRKNMDESDEKFSNMSLSTAILSYRQGES